MKLAKLLLSFTIALALNACASNTQNASITKKGNINLNETTWKLLDEDNLTVKGFDNKDVILILNNNVATGFGGCNAFNTSYTINNNVLNFNAVARTKMSCPNISTENSFVNVLDQVNRYEVKANILYLYKDNLLLLKFTS